MRSSSLLLAAALSAAVAALFACEERFSANPPPLSPESLGPASSTAMDSLLAPLPTDAGAPVADGSHAMSVVLCSWAPDACPAGDAEAAGDGTYRVVFGSGRGAIRSRGQAMADLYKELRDRIQSGQHLDAEVHAPGDGGASLASRGGSTKPAASDSDPLSQCAFQLLNLVDGVGGVTLDAVHGSGSSGCKVSLGHALGDGGASRCLVRGEQSEHSPGK